MRHLYLLRLKMPHYQLALAFGGMLRHLNVPSQGESQRGHELDKPNEVIVLTDDERPLVFVRRRAATNHC